MMKRTLLALSAIAAIALPAGLASAQEFHIGPGGVYVGPHHGYRDFDRNCRVVISHHTNEWGNDVTVRRRICD